MCIKMSTVYEITWLFIHGMKKFSSHHKRNLVMEGK